jgi:dihydroorotase
MSPPEPTPDAGRAGCGEARLVGAPARPADLLVHDVHVLDPRTGLDGLHDVLVRDGQIAELSAPGALTAPPGLERVDGTGRHLFPAFVDPHVHLRTPGQEHKEDLETGTRAAAAGGYCALLGMPNTAPVVDSAPILGALFDAAAREARVPVGFLPCITRGQAGRELTEMAELRSIGAAGFTDDGRPIADAGVMRRALQYQRLCGGVLALHEEDPTLSGAGAMHEGAISALLGVAGIPSVSESTIVERDCALAGYEGGRIHLQHLSAHESVTAVAAAKARGVQVTCEASPHHLTLTDEHVRTLDTRRKMNPPLRGVEDRAALVEGLRTGVIDCIATDHAPHARDEKEVPFEQAPMGTTGLETAFAVLYTELVEPGTLELALVVEKLTAGLGLMGLFVPRIAIGERANLVLVDLAAEWVVGESGYESRSENCAFAGKRLKGNVLLTVAAGAVAFRERSIMLSAAPLTSSGGHRSR